MKVGCKIFWLQLQWEILGILPQNRYNQLIFILEGLAPL